MQQHEVGFRMPWKVLGSGWILAFAMWAALFCVVPMEHILKEALALTHTQTILLFTIPMMALAVVSIPGGILADRIGARKAAGIGAIIIVVGSLMRATAETPSSLLAFTAIYGVGLGLTFPNFPKLVSAWVPRERAGVATGAVLSGMLAGGAVAMAITVPFIFPVTNTYQGTFLIWSIGPIVAAILWWTLVKEPPRSDQEVIIDSKAQSVGSLKSILANKWIWMIASLLLLNEFSFNLWTAWAPASMMLRGASPELAGVISSAALWAGIPAAIFIPRLSFKVGLRKPFVWVPSILFAVIAWASMHVSLTGSWVFMGLVGAVSASRFLTLAAMPIELLPEEEVGRASGLVLSLAFVGGVIGAQVGGRILDLTGRLDLSFLVLIGASIAMAIVALQLPETGRKASYSK